MNSLKSYHDLEIDAHVTLDDALSKTTQELGELLVAYRKMIHQKSKKNQPISSSISFLSWVMLVWKYQKARNEVSR
jgi:hypothetical protein